MSAMIDDARALLEAARWSVTAPLLHDTLSRALTAIRPVIPYDLAVLYELDGNELSATNAEGPLANAEILRHRLSLLKFPTIVRALESQRPIALEAHHHASAEGDPYDNVLNFPHGHSCMVVPLASGDQRLGLITFDRAACETYAPESVELAAVLGQLLSTAIMFARQADALNRFREQLEEHSRVLADDRGGASTACTRLAAAKAPSMQRVTEAVRQVAPTPVTVLLVGETGSGKEVVAEAIHHQSGRAERPFVKINCAALPAQLIESELFGHVRGAFSGADRERLGRFRAANGGTLFLDEIGDMPLSMQAKLLRVLQEGTFEPVGADVTVRVDVRVLAATNVDLEAAVAAGTFRQDLYFRIATFPLRIPPLRERVEDIEVIALDHLRIAARGSQRWTLSAEGLAALQSQPFPGNIRELKNVLDRAMILMPSGELTAEHLRIVVSAAAPNATHAASPMTTTLVTWAEMERAHLSAALAVSEGKIYGKDGAAAILGLPPTTLQGKLKKHSLS